MVNSAKITIKKVEIGGGKMNKYYITIPEIEHGIKSLQKEINKDEREIDALMINPLHNNLEISVRQVRISQRSMFISKLKGVLVLAEREAVK